MLKVLRFRLMESTPGAGGSTSAPSSTPTTESNGSSTSSNESGGADFDFADLATYNDGDSFPPNAAPTTPTPSAGAAPSPPPTPSPSPAPTPAPTPSAAPASTTAAPATSPAPQTQAPVQQPGQSPAAATTTAPTPGSGVPTPQQVSQTFAEHRAQFLPRLQQLYQIEGSPAWDAAAIEELRTAPEKALPKLAANLHYEVQLATYNSVMEAMPVMIGHILTQRKAADEAETMFKGMYPRLYEKPEYEQAAESSIRAMKAANPNMATPELLKRAGMMAMLTLGLPLDMPGVSGAPNPSPTPTPTPTPTPSQIPIPGRPAGVHASGAPGSMAPAGATDNIFADLVNETIAGNI